ncbi:hypothetical protein B484DRAFT_150260 [Ochromonadaceae sp. CCMP2298]|nr:hypothetical protein B484DRAFT_150435 [Ochromonadaceae sp. CCMP2298]KAJ1417240.1 hypothetical protein B484DRAFT_150260 [Ochromonadaceae sp. CCMP2298]
MVVPSLWLLCAACLLAAVQGFASYMTTKHCDRTLIGEMIMAKEAVADATRTIQVSRGDSPVQNGTVIGDLSGLSVRLEPKLFQVLFEVSDLGSVVGEWGSRVTSD